MPRNTKETVEETREDGEPKDKKETKAKEDPRMEEDPEKGGEPGKQVLILKGKMRENVMILMLSGIRERKTMVACSN